MSGDSNRSQGMGPWIRVALVAAALLAWLPGGSPEAQGPNLLQDGGFEEGLGSWGARGGDLYRVGAPLRSGSYAGALAAGGSAWAFQDVAVVPGGSYTFQGWVWPQGAGAVGRLRLTWLSAEGKSLAEVDSQAVGPESPSFTFLTLGPALAPARAQRALAQASLSAPGQATLYLDDMELLGPAPTPTPIPTPAPTSTPTPTPAPTPTFTPAPTPTLIPTLPPQPTPTPTLPPTGTPGLIYLALGVAGLGAASLLLGSWAWRKGWARR